MTFGPAAYAFADFLASARQGVWQVLPLGPLGFGNSPYSSPSAFAGNPLLISLERLADRGWISRTQLDTPPSNVEPVDYPAVFHRKLPLLFEAAHNFLQSASPDPASQMRTPATTNSADQNSWWLDDFVLFDALRARFHLESWNRWPRELTHRDPAALEKAREEMQEDLEFAAPCSSSSTNNGGRFALIVPSVRFASSETSLFSSTTTAPTCGRIPIFFA